MLPVSGATEVPEPIVRGHLKERFGPYKRSRPHFFLLEKMSSSAKKVPKVRRKYGVSTSSKMHSIRCARAVSYPPDKTHVALGRNDGQIATLEGKTFNPIRTVNMNSQSKRQSHTLSGPPTQSI
mmetsp:Transcript_14619/g.20479  ORF Transcript_14619/g.20479 Transcript_14619/m.20479 type:complete len:124 (+) Transcript_14619:216-587(+)